MTGRAGDAVSCGYEDVVEDVVDRARVVAWLRDLADLDPRDPYWSGLRDGLLEAAIQLERGVGAIDGVDGLRSRS